jgi:hypothetical protein
MNCGKLKSYKIKQIITNEIIYNDTDLSYVTKNTDTKYSEPKCPKCGRYVKFFKDADELESER